MGRPAVKWGVARRYFLKQGYTIRQGSSGDKIIVAPKDGKPRSRSTCLIGHRYSDHDGDELADGHLSAIRRAFAVTWQQILNG